MPNKEPPEHMPTPKKDGRKLCFMIPGDELTPQLILEIALSQQFGADNPSRERRFVMLSPCQLQWVRSFRSQPKAFRSVYV